MNTGAIVNTIFKEYLKPITYYSTLAKIFGPHYFLFFAFILNNMVPKNYNARASQKVSDYNAEEQAFWLGFFLIAIASTVVSSIVSLIAGDTFLLIASSTEAGSMQE